MIEMPDLSDTSEKDLCALMLAPGLSSDASDKAFAKACRDELARRKPAPIIQHLPADDTEGGAL